MLVTPLENAEGRRLVKSWTNLAREDVLPIPGGGRTCGLVGSTSFMSSNASCTSLCCMW